jgi:hypothetical protein
VLLEGGREWFDALHLPDEDPAPQPVEGLGDEALWQDGLASLDVVDGDHFITVQPVLFLSDADSFEAAQQIAALVLGRLPG